MSHTAPAGTAHLTRGGLLRVIAADDGLSRLYSHVQQRMRSDAAHDLEHALRVALWTLRLGGDGIDVREAVAAALLHDIVHVPKNDPARSHASELSAAEARTLLPEAGFDDAAVHRIADAIRDHSFSRGAVPDTPLGCALQDADRLEALGTLGTFRCIATGVAMNAAFFDADDPWARQRPLDDARFSTDHFFAKLLRLPATMLTAAGRAEAGRRADIMVLLLRRLGEEIGEPLQEDDFARDR